MPKKKLSRYMANQETLYLAEGAMIELAFDDGVIVDKEEFARRYKMLFKCLRGLKERIDDSGDWETAARNIGSMDS